MPHHSSREDLYGPSSVRVLVRGLLRFVGIHGNLGLLMLHEHVGTLYFTDRFRVVMGA
jgi:hypothetical protein